MPQGVGGKPNRQNSSCPPSSQRTGVLRPLPSLPRWAAPRALGPSGEPYLFHLGPPRAESCVPGLSVFIASTCAVLWAWWPAASAPRLGATIPGRPFADPARTPVGPSRSWSQPLCLPPLQAGPSQGCTGACPCFSSSDWEINSPKEPGCLLLVSGWGKGQGPFAAVEPPQLLDNEFEVF